MRRTYDYDHRVTFDETNVVGNVYFASHVHWQGRCRELFLHDHAPGVLDALSDDLALVTLHCSVDYLDELWPLDSVRIRMGLEEMVQNRVRLGFEYLRVARAQTGLVARGAQEVACMRRGSGGLEPVAVPEELAKALEPYS